MNSTVLVSAISSVIAILFIAVLLIVICKFKRKKRTTSAVEENNDENPVYGMYYFSDGEHIDYGTTEVQDDNDAYGS